MARRETTGNRIKGDSIVRFGVHPIIQHVLMFSSFAVLAMTGLPMKYSDWSSSKWWMGLWGGVANVSAVHHVAAWVMVAACVYHLGYILFSVVVLRRPFPSSMLPRVKDLGDFAKDMKHTFGLSKDTPRFDRFSYRNKGAYWLVFVGAFVTVCTGLVLMYPVWTAGHFPGWMNPLALVIHSDAAILAVGWMLIVHMYFAHLAKHVFPMDKSIFTGKVPIARYKTEFPLEYERIMAAAEPPVTTPEEPALWDPTLWEPILWDSAPSAPPASAQRPEVARPVAARPESLPSQAEA